LLPITLVTAAVKFVMPVKLGKPVTNINLPRAKMKKLLLATAAVTLTVAASTFSTPADARVFCFNRNTGQFLYWGHCQPARVVCNYYGPGGYCRRAVPYVVWR
jgi:hypothetical protein